MTIQEELVPCRPRNVINNPLVDRDRIIFPPLQTKLILIKQFTKALDKDGGCFTFFCHAFTGLTMEILKAGILDGQLIRDSKFENSMNEVEIEEWKAFVLIVLGNNKARKYAELTTNTLTSFRNLGCSIGIKMHYLFSHIERFPDNLGLMGVWRSPLIYYVFSYNYAVSRPLVASPRRQPSCRVFLFFFLFR